MRLPRLLQTTAVRLALRYVLIYTLVLSVALVALFWSAQRHLDPAVKFDLERELAELQQRFDYGGSTQLIEAIATRNASAERRLYLLVSADGEIRAGNLHDWPDEAEITPDGKVDGVWMDDEILPRGWFGDDAYLPVIAVRLADGSRLLLAQGIEQNEELFKVTEYLVEVLGIVVPLLLLLGTMLGRAILRRMDAIGRTASDIMTGDLSRRVPVSGRQDEFDTLALRLNAMLDRIQQLVNGMREVTDNIAHDLRSPLTRLRNRLEITLLEPRSEADYRDTLRLSIADTAGLITTFNTLLEIAQAEAGNPRAAVSSVDLAGLVRDLGELYAPAAEERSLILQVSADTEALIAGNRNLLAQALGNLLDNAIKYTPAGGVISLRLDYSPSIVAIVVTDSGPGIPAGERAHVLERFVRLESARGTPGNGLGLSLVHAVAKLLRAELWLADACPGLRVTLRFAKISSP